MTHSVGRAVWKQTDSTVASIYFSSSRTGVMITYRINVPTPSPTTKCHKMQPSCEGATRAHRKRTLAVVSRARGKSPQEFAEHFCRPMVLRDVAKRPL